VEDRVQVVVDRLTALAGRPAVLEDVRLRLIAFSPHHEALDAVRSASILSREASSAVRAHLTRRLGGAVEPVRVPAEPALGMDERVCIPVVRDSRVVGYVWFVDAGGDLDEETVRGLVALARQLAEHLDGVDAGTDTRSALRAVLERPEEARRWAPELRGAGDEPFVLAAIGAVDPAPPPDRLDRAVDAAVRELRPGVRRRVLQTEHRGRCVLLLPEEGCDALLRDVVARARRALVRIGGAVAVVAGASRARTELAESARAAAEASLVLRALELGDLPGPVQCWQRLPPAGLAVRLAADAGSPLHPGLTALTEDAEHAALLETLEVYLDTAGNVQEAARRLNLHRTSLYHRLHRIERLADSDLKSGADRLALHLSLKVARLRSEPEPVAAATAAAIS